MSASQDKNCTPFLRALADENRWQLVRLLLAGPRTVSELVEAAGMSQYNVSKHLRVLRETGIVEAHREGKFVICRISSAFQNQVDSAGGHSLDLGCCCFHFDLSDSKTGELEDR